MIVTSGPFQSNRLLGIVSLVVLIAWIDPAVAQTVQLPSFRTFSYSGSVLVPDGGTAFLGGNSSAISGAAGRGFGNHSVRRFGSRQAASGLSASVTVIDHSAIDRRLLGTASPQQATVDEVAGRGVDPTKEGKSLVRHARRLYREGDESASFDTYRMAIDVLSGELRSLAIDEFRRGFGTAAQQSLAARPPQRRR